MPRDRLNLTVEQDALERARRYGDRHGVSLSRLVSDYFRTLPDPTASTPDLTPAVRRLLGTGAGAGDREDYRRHLEEKYGP
jgi:hypothetical protein